MNGPLTRIVGAFMLLIVAVLVAINNFKPETKQTQPQPQHQSSEVSKPKLRLTTSKKEKSEKPSNQFTIETRVSMADPNQNND